MPGTVGLRADVALLEPGEAGRQDLPGEAPILLPRQGVKGCRREEWRAGRGPGTTLRREPPSPSWFSAMLAACVLDPG